jgi:hypothetical protein
VYPQEDSKLPGLIHDPVPDAADAIPDKNSDFMNQQKCHILAAEVIFPENVVLCEESNKHIYNATKNKEPASSVVYKKDDGGKCEIELYQIPDNGVDLVAQPRD